jgi:hypothetical protein
VSFPSVAPQAAHSRALALDELAVDDATTTGGLGYVAGEPLGPGVVEYSDSISELEVGEVPSLGKEHGREQDGLGGRARDSHVCHQDRKIPERGREYERVG